MYIQETTSWKHKVGQRVQRKKQIERKKKDKKTNGKQQRANYKGEN